MNYLLAAIPDHIIMPTLVSLGATDILKLRGVPIGFIGVNTEIERVDGWPQTSYEFWMHDINHSRRMYQFAVEYASKLGISSQKFFEKSSQFIKDKLLPLFIPTKNDTEEMKKQKGVVKMVLFEIVHEDALAADPAVIKAALLRPAGHRTPFEIIKNGNTVQYFMEPGATTLAFVFRKLAHAFYDTPEERKDYIVNRDYRTRKLIFESSMPLFKMLDMNEGQLKTLETSISTDEGFPEGFKKEIMEDIQKRKSQVEPLKG